MDVQNKVYMASVLVRCEWRASRLGRFIPAEGTTGTKWTRSWAGSRTGLNDTEERKFLPILGLKPRPQGSPTHSQSPYRLRYHASLKHDETFYTYLTINFNYLIFNY
jgi:hypothetical protein